MTFEVTGSHVGYASSFTRVRVDTVRMPDGAEVEREVAVQADAVGVVAINDASQVVLLRQYRHPVGGHLLEIPAGKLDVEGEAPLAAAQRELLEEAGVATEEWTELVRFHNSAGWTDESTTVYLATGVFDAEPPEHFVATAEEADMEVVLVPLADAVRKAEQGEIADAKTLIGLLLAARRLDPQG